MIILKVPFADPSAGCPCLGWTEQLQMHLRYKFWGKNSFGMIKFGSKGQDLEWGWEENLPAETISWAASREKFSLSISRWILEELFLNNNYESSATCRNIKSCVGNSKKTRVTLVSWLPLLFLKPFPSPRTFFWAVGLKFPWDFLCEPQGASTIHWTSCVSWLPPGAHAVLFDQTFWHDCRGDVNPRVHEENQGSGEWFLLFCSFLGELCLVLCLDWGFAHMPAIKLNSFMPQVMKSALQDLYRLKVS